MQVAVVVKSQMKKDYSAVLELFQQDNTVAAVGVQYKQFIVQILKGKTAKHNIANI